MSGHSQPKVIYEKWSTDLLYTDTFHWITMYREFLALKISYATCCRKGLDRLFHRRKNICIMCYTYIFYERHSKKTNFSASSVRERSSWRLQSDRQIKMPTLNTSCRSCKAQRWHWRRQWNFVFTIRSILHSYTHRKT